MANGRSGEGGVASSGMLMGGGGARPSTCHFRPYRAGGRVIRSETASTAHDCTELGGLPSTRHPDLPSLGSVMLQPGRKPWPATFRTLLPGGRTASTIAVTSSHAAFGGRRRGPHVHGVSLSPKRSQATCKAQDDPIEGFSPPGPGGSDICTPLAPPFTPHRWSIGNSYRRSGR